MNVNHVESVKTYPKRVLHAIFAKQEEVMPKYHEIEKKNGLCQTDMMPFNLHDRHCQARIKDFLWRTTEELAESLEVVMSDNNEFGMDHIIEEIIDAIHFHTENCIQCGITADDILMGNTLDYVLNDLVEFHTQNIVSAESLFLNTIISLGLAGNCLKNKPWKQDHKLTDIEKFKKIMVKAYIDLLTILSVAYRLDEKDIFDMYFRKNEVNKFRQRSGY